MSEFQLRPIHELLLRGTQDIPVGLYQLQMATAEQLTRLHYRPGCLKAVKARLKLLADEEYVQASTIPTKYYKSPYYYTLGPKGMRYVAGLGMDAHPAWRASKEVDKNALFVTHTLELNDVLIAAALLHTTQEQFQLARFEHERALKRKPYRVHWQTDYASFSHAVIPDAFLDFRQQGTNLRCAVILEHDRGTEEQAHFKRKIAAYVAYLKEHAYRQQFGVTQALIAFTTFHSEYRLEQMRLWTRQALYGETAALAQCFTFALLEKHPTPQQAWLDAVWYGPDDPSDPGPLLAA